MLSDVEHLCMYLSDICMSSLENCPQILCQFFNQSVCLLLLSYVIYIFGILGPYRMYDLQIFSSIQLVPFHFVDVFLAMK